MNIRPYVSEAFDALVLFAQFLMLLVAVRGVFWLYDRARSAR